MASCRGGDGSADFQPAQPARLQHCRWGRRDGGGPSRVTVLRPVYLPRPQHWGEGGGRSSVRVEEGEPSLMRVSSKLVRGLAANLCRVSSELVKD